MRTEEENRQKHKLNSLSVNLLNTNLVESSNVKDKFKNKGKQIAKPSQKKGQFKAASGKIEKSKVICYVCGKLGHKFY